MKILYHEKTSACQILFQHSIGSAIQNPDDETMRKFAKNSSKLGRNGKVRMPCILEQDRPNREALTERQKILCTETFIPIKLLNFTKIQRKIFGPDTTVVPTGLSMEGSYPTNKDRNRNYDRYEPSLYGPDEGRLEMVPDTVRHIHKIGLETSGTSRQQQDQDYHKITIPSNCRIIENIKRTSSQCRNNDITLIISKNKLIYRTYDNQISQTFKINRCTAPEVHSNITGNTTSNPFAYGSSNLMSVENSRCVYIDRDCELDFNENYELIFFWQTLKKIFKIVASDTKVEMYFPVKRKIQIEDDQDSSSRSRQRVQQEAVEENFNSEKKLINPLDDQIVFFRLKKINKVCQTTTFTCLYKSLKIFEGGIVQSNIPSQLPENVKKQLRNTGRVATERQSKITKNKVSKSLKRKVPATSTALNTIGPPGLPMPNNFESTRLDKITANTDEKLSRGIDLQNCEISKLNKDSDSTSPNPKSSSVQRVASSTQRENLPQKSGSQEKSKIMSPPSQGVTSGFKILNLGRSREKETSMLTTVTNRTTVRRVKNLSKRSSEGITTNSKFISDESRVLSSTSNKKKNSGDHPTRKNWHLHMISTEESEDTTIRNSTSSRESNNEVTNLEMVSSGRIQNSSLQKRFNTPCSYRYPLYFYHKDNFGNRNFQVNYNSGLRYLNGGEWAQFWEDFEFDRMDDSGERQEYKRPE